MEKMIVDIIGWLGSALLVAAYILVSKKRIDPESIPYQGMNLGGSVMLIVNSYYFLLVFPFYYFQSTID